MKERTEAVDDDVADGAEANNLMAGDSSADGRPDNDSGEAEVSLLLGSWNSAAERLEEAHRAACDEIRRLREELAAKDVELAQRHRAADFSEMVARAAHEVQDRLRSVRKQLDLFQRRLVNDPSGTNLADRLAADLAGCDIAMEDLIGFAFQREPEADLLSVRALVEGAKTALARQLTQRAVHVVVDVPEEARTRGDQQLLQRAIVNVVLQALDQVPRGGELLVAAAERLEATEVEIACGILPAGRPSAAPPELDQAIAVLRWPVVHHILQQHGGEVLTKADAQGGTAYLLRIPHIQSS